MDEIDKLLQGIPDKKEESVDDLLKRIPKRSEVNSIDELLNTIPNKGPIKAPETSLWAKIPSWVPKAAEYTNEAVMRINPITALPTLEQDVEKMIGKAVTGEWKPITEIVGGNLSEYLGKKGWDPYLAGTLSTVLSEIPNIMAGLKGDKLTKALKDLEYGMNQARVLQRLGKIDEAETALKKIADDYRPGTAGEHGFPEVSNAPSPLKPDTLDLVKKKIGLSKTPEGSLSKVREEISKADKRINQIRKEFKAQRFTTKLNEEYIELLERKNGLDKTMTKMNTPLVDTPPVTNIPNTKDVFRETVYPKPTTKTPPAFSLDEVPPASAPAVQRAKQVAQKVESDITTSQITERLSTKLSGRKLEDELKHGAELFPASTLRKAEKDLLPGGRLITVDRSLRGHGFIESGQRATGQVENDLVEIQTFLKPHVKFLARNKQAHANVAEALDKGRVDLLSSDQERQAYTAIRSTFDTLAARLGIPRDKFISDYLTHIFKNEYQFITEDLAGNASVKNLHFRYLLERNGGAPPKLDILEALQGYVPLALRQIHYQPAITLMNGIADNMSSQPFRQAVAREFIDNFAGVPKYKGVLNQGGEAVNNAIDGLFRFATQQLDGLKVVPKNGKFIVKNSERIIHETDTAEAANIYLQTLNGFKPNKANRAALMLTGNMYRGTIALNLRASAKNLQQTMNTIITSGLVPTGKAAWKMMTDKNARRAVRSILGPGRMSRELNEGVVNQAVKGFDNIIFKPFDFAETTNRGIAFWAGVENAKKGGASIDEAIRLGIQNMNDTQFLYGVLGRSPALTQPLTRPLGAFTSFTMKQGTFVYQVMRDGILAAKETGTLRNAESKSAMRLVGMAGLLAHLSTEYGLDAYQEITGGIASPKEFVERVRKGWNPVGGIIKNLAMSFFDPDKSEYHMGKVINDMRLFTGMPWKGVELMRNVSTIIQNPKGYYDVIDQAGNSVYSLSAGAAKDFAWGMPNEEVDAMFTMFREERKPRGLDKPSATQRIMNPGLRLE